MMREIAALFTDGLGSCRLCPERQSRYAAWTCGHCFAATEERLQPETVRYLILQDLRRAGYPFGQDDLDFEDWLVLGQIEELIVGLPSPSGSTH